jgi:hypothetical protein
VWANAESESPRQDKKEVPLPVEAWKRDSGSDGRRSRDLSIFSRLELLDAEPKARQFPVIMRAIDACVIQEISTDSLQL